MLIRIGIWSSIRYTAITRMRRRAYTWEGLHYGHWTRNFNTPYFHVNGRYEKRSACKNHSRLAQLISINKEEELRARTSFALLRSALICLRGLRARIKAFCDFKNTDFDIQPKKEPWCNINTLWPSWSPCKYKHFTKFLFFFFFCSLFHAFKNEVFSMFLYIYSYVGCEYHF